ncbi:hypothetical protein BBK36DRAFT_1162563 [Trichoderma citrinoviride]|uniref:Eisosome protein 1 n=1 Tax=Trichoderma citrinoviride TaxID=58853 RepID=A0A2T4B0C8_9HYPO|nr:hypothetical protein BBK36DRAFT_1162563 [Trichoderma citrinoviride]PTB62777.1 hypothetical protein BBK36DRAFT_1162563 [Trichoderma citrinoviride]
MLASSVICFRLGALSRLSTAGRLKYADPRSLPSFPSSGLSPGGAAASAAASLGWFTHKPVETWKPDKASSASAAAVLAKDYKMSPLWEPTMDGTGTKAAVLAVGSANTAYRQSSVKKPSYDSWGNSAATQAFSANARRPDPEPEPVTLTTSHGSSAATQAFHASRLQSAKAASSPPGSPREKSLVAARGAMSPSKLGTPRSRLRSYSNPQESYYPNATKASASALNGASIAHRAAMNKPAEVEDTGAIPVTTMTRNMFTSHPLIGPEADEQTNNERIHQSAVEMAKKMYRQQQSRRESDGRDSGAGETSANGYVDLQEAAYRQAQERLAKLQDEHERNRRYHEYYGADKPLRRRFTIVNKLRRRSASDSDMEGRARSDLIRQQMTLFSSRLDQVDEEKRQRDREALYTAAQRNVKASLQGMDEKVYFDTGKMNPAVLGDWQFRAQQAAQLRHDTRTEGDGRVDIGGGVFMDADEIDAIAARRVRPVLDDIHEKAEAERERVASARMEEEANKAEAEREKARERELKDLQKKAKEEDKQQEKARRQQEREEEKHRREEEKMAKAEQKKLAKEERRKPKTEPEAATGAFDPTLQGETAGREADTQSRRISHVPEVTTPPAQQETAADLTDSSPKKSPETPTSPTARVKGWIKNRFSRGKSLSEPDEKKKSFVGGAALREPGPGGSTASLDNRSTSIREVTLAGRGAPETGGVPGTADVHPHLLNRDSRGVSPVSSGSGRSSDIESFETPQPIMDQPPRQGNSPMRDSRFREMMDQ